MCTHHQQPSTLDAILLAKWLLQTRMSVRKALITATRTLCARTQLEVSIARAIWASLETGWTVEVGVELHEHKHTKETRANSVIH